MILWSFRCENPKLCSVIRWTSILGTACSVDTVCGEVCWHCSLESSGIFLEENNSIHHFYCEGNGCLCKNLLLHFKAKTTTHRWCNHWYCELPAASSVTISHLSLSCRQGISTTQAWKPCCVCSVVWDSTGLWLLMLPVMWITNSSRYNSFLVRVATHPTLHFMSFVLLPAITVKEVSFFPLEANTRSTKYNRST